MFSRAQRLGLRVPLHQLLELEQEGGILVPREQPEEHPVGQLERASGAGPLELEQPPVLGMVPTSLMPWAPTGQDREVPAPGAGILLPLDHRQRGLGLGHRHVGGRDRLRGGVSGWGQSVRVRYRIDGPAFSSSQVSGIRCWCGSSRSAPGWEGKRPQNRGRGPAGGRAAALLRPRLPVRSPCDPGLPEFGVGVPHRLGGGVGDRHRCPDGDAKPPNPPS